MSCLLIFLSSKNFASVILERTIIDEDVRRPEDKTLKITVEGVPRDFQQMKKLLLLPLIISTMFTFIRFLDFLDLIILKRGIKVGRRGSLFRKGS